VFLQIFARLDGSGLMRVAQRLAREGYLAFTPCFLFPVISSLGSMNSDMTKLVKWIIGRYKGTLKSAPLREDGMPKTVLLGRFSLYGTLLCSRSWQCAGLV